MEANPAWLSDGRGIVLNADRGGSPHLFKRNLLSGTEDELRTTGPVSVGTPTTLFTLPPSTTWQDFDVSLDGKRFLAVIPQVRPSALPLTVVLNWTTAVQRR